MADPDLSQIDRVERSEDILENIPINQNHLNLPIANSPAIV